MRKLLVLKNRFSVAEGEEKESYKMSVMALCDYMLENKDEVPVKKQDYKFNNYNEVLLMLGIVDVEELYKLIEIMHKYKYLLDFEERELFEEFNKDLREQG